MSDSRKSHCFVAMPFLPELDYFYLFLQQHLCRKHDLVVERGDTEILTRPFIDKVRDQISRADLVIGDVTGGNPNVFYELGWAHAQGKPVIFISQDEPEDTPVDVQHFEIIRYDLGPDAFLKKLDKATSGVLFERYKRLHEPALELLDRFNRETGTAYGAASKEDFQARVVRARRAGDPFPLDREDLLAAALLPVIINEIGRPILWQQVNDWIAKAYPEAE